MLVQSGAGVPITLYVTAALKKDGAYGRPQDAELSGESLPSNRER